MFRSSLWFVGTTLILDTQNPEISGFSTAHEYIYIQNQAAKMKLRQRKMAFLLISHQSTFGFENKAVSTDHRRAKKINH